ncbi:hypothetical protein BDR06DRAFT_957650, partial [Suillus hirtellus]
MQRYVGGTGNTAPFDKAPPSVCGALALIEERSRLALQKDTIQRDPQRCIYGKTEDFHSDSEHGLSPSPCSLSLGSAAFMHFRARATSKEPKHSSSNMLTLIPRHHYKHTVIPMNFRIAATARCGI